MPCWLGAGPGYGTPPCPPSCEGSTPACPVTPGVTGVAVVELTGSPGIPGRPGGLTPGAPGYATGPGWTPCCPGAWPGSPGLFGSAGPANCPGANPDPSAPL